MNANALRGPRIGVMVHYAAGDYASTVSWCKDPTSKVSYNQVIGPKGQLAQIVPWNLRAWHAGVCRPSSAALDYTDANSAFYGLALSGGPQFGPPTQDQIEGLVNQIRARFADEGWVFTETWRIVGHDTEAWPRGRKQDPTGTDKDHPWLDLTFIRERVAR